MGLCNVRYIFLVLCLLQMVSVIERQVFDFLGYLWIPILVNFLELVFIIFGFFGAYQYRTKYVTAYLLWTIFWLVWNAFQICLYLDLAGLDHKTNKVLKLDKDSGSWWKNGPGCKETPVDDGEPNHVKIENCLLDYVFVEVCQSGLQCVLGVLSLILGMSVIKQFLEEDDTSSRKSSRKNTKRMSLYSIEFSSQLDHRQGDSDTEFERLPQAPVSPKPMTPRRVKRRSVMTRGSSGRHSTSSRRQSHSRSSVRSSRRMAQNPVTRLMEQQKNQQLSSSYDSPASPSPPMKQLPNYYNRTSNNNLLTAPPVNWPVQNGHTNPTYQQSSTQSLNDTLDFDDLYNNRPASVRSSYSNFHGTRALNYSPPKPHSHSNATPQVPQKRNHPNRTSMRSMAFLSNGPPAYTTQSQTLDSETTI